ncbi:VOC family protein [Kiloniella antarctica]|uniref:VOC family protein n=1 Tax=Kiloniella antarctica TaxID=1550907 RepID=A0ABW5BIG4_9PROT
MTVKRIVANLAVKSVPTAQKFYMNLFGLEVVMDHGWITTLSSGEMATVQISLASEGGSGTPVPDLSIEVDNVDAVYELAKKLEHKIVYDLTDEPWGVRRFYLCDPNGKILNVLSHPCQKSH